MTELTKEQLIEEAKLKIAIAKCHPNSGMAQVEGELFKIALASLEAEPVAWTDDGRDQFESLIRFHADDNNHATLLLRANGGMNYQAPNVDLAWIFWKSSREHMLQGKGEPGKQVRGLIMLVKQLAWQLRKAKPDCKLPGKAMDYLKRNGLISAEDILR